MLNIKPAVVGPGEGRIIKVIGLDVTVKLSSSETGGELFVFENPMVPGDRVPMHKHSREDEIIEVIEGELEITIGDKDYTASAGSVAYFPRNIAHGFHNPSDTTALVRVTVTPGANFEAFFTELSSLPADGPPDMGKVAEIFAKYGVPIVENPPA